jgi:hypothetical protein
MRMEIADAGAALGAIILLVSLFLTWYKPDLTAWTAFEVLDLVLAALAIATLAALATASGLPAAVPERALPWLGGVASVIAIAALINHPPLALGHPPGTGAWLGLAGSLLMLAGGVARAARVSLAITFENAPAPPVRRPPPPRSEAHTEPLPKE